MLGIAALPTATFQMPAFRPTYVQVAAADYNALNTALGNMQIAGANPVTITASPVVGGVQVTLTGISAAPIDGILSLIAAATPQPAGWPAAQRVGGIAIGQSQTYRFTLPAKAAVKSVQLQFGDEGLQTITVPYAIR